jgi:hypothetical protein
VWSAAFVPGAPWSSAHGQPVPSGWFAGPVAKSAGNRAIVAWEVTTNEEAIVSAQHFVGPSLGAPVPLRSADRFSQSAPAVDIDTAGTSVAVWSGADGVHARWFAGGAWGPDLVLTAVNASCPVVALDGAGGAIVAWREIANVQVADSDASVVVARLRPAGWQGREAYSNPSFRSDCPAIASAASGGAIVAWANAGANRGLWARSLGGSSAGQVVKLDDVDAGHEVRSLRVVMDAAGDGYVAWVRARSDTATFGYPVTKPPTGPVWASRFVDGGAGWGTPAGLQGPSATDTATMVDVAVDAGGNAIALWFEFADNRFTPWSSRAARP